MIVLQELLVKNFQLINLSILYFLDFVRLCLTYYILLIIRRI